MTTPAGNTTNHSTKGVEFIDRLYKFFNLDNVRKLSEVTGIHLNTLYNYSRGFRDPDPSIILKLAQDTGITPKWLAKGEGTPGVTVEEALKMSGRSMPSSRVARPNLAVANELIETYVHPKVEEHLESTSVETNPPANALKHKMELGSAFAVLEGLVVEVYGNELILKFHKIKGTDNTPKEIRLPL